MTLSTTQRPCTQHRFLAHDNCELFYRSWLPKSRIQRAVVLLHRGHEHSGRWQGTVDGLALEDTAFFAWDGRGHGLSQGERGAARHISVLCRDLENFYRHLLREHCLEQEDVAVIAHSFAAIVAGLWAVDYAPRLRAMVLAAPAFDIKLYVPLARPALQAVSAFCRVRGKPVPPVRSYVSGSWLTRDGAQQRAYDADPLICKRISMNLLLDVAAGSRRLAQNAGALPMPVQLLCARADSVVRNAPSRAFFSRLVHPRKEVRVYRDFCHSLFHEKDRERVFHDVTTFLTDVFGVGGPGAPDLERACRCGPQAEDFQWLKAGPPRLSIRNVTYNLGRFALRTVGGISRGLRLGLRTGFSSGLMLDYVYQNRPQGFGLMGRALDRFYLASPGWRGIRTRKLHLEQLLEEVCESLPGPTRILDVAAGAGRYLVDFARSRPAMDLRILLRDLDEAALDEGRASARGDSRIAYEKDDVFAHSEIQRTGEADIGVVSGLFELIADNDPVRRALENLAASVRPGGYLIYTNQSWHPQLDIIAELLTHGDGSPWVMRCRSQREMDGLVLRAGFEKLRSLLDDDGLFSVSLARRSL